MALSPRGNPDPLTLALIRTLNLIPTLTRNPDLKPSQVALELPVRRDPRWARLRARLLRGRHRLPGQLPHLVAQRREECTERK